MPKRVLDVGQCDMDHAALRQLIETGFDACVVQSHGADEALAELRRGKFDLVLVNRKLDRDASEGLSVVRRVKDDEQLKHIPCMLVTNFNQHQDRAIQAGAEPGFGKASLDTFETRQLLRRYLD